MSVEKSEIGSPSRQRPESCHVCNSARITYIQKLSFYTKTGLVDTEIMRCKSCRVCWRNFPEPLDLTTHYEIASYTDTGAEENLRARRKSFYEQIHRLFLRYHDSQVIGPRVLDIGCAFGHMLELFHERGFACTGLEPLSRLCELINGRGKIEAYQSFEQIPEMRRFDLVTLIDSLYCSPDPQLMLKRAAERMTDQGVLIIRIANRLPLLNVFRLLRRPFTNSEFGDQLIALSHKSMMMLFKGAGLDVKGVHYHEDKPITGFSWNYFVYYRILPIVAAVTRVKVSPGLIYVCKKA